MYNDTPYYKDNPNLEKEVVTTFKGVKEYRCNCRKIKNQLYIKDIDCFHVDNKWYRLNSGLIELDYSTNKYFVKDKKPANLMKGIVKYENGEVIFGYFQSDPYSMVNVQYRDGQYPCINDEVASSFCKEIISQGVYVDIGSWRSDYGRISNRINNQQYDYNIDDNLNRFTRQIELYNGFNTKVKKAVAKYSNYLGDSTFGAEIECIRGYLPEHLRNQLGISICRDGSLKDEDGTQGPEYTTVPLQSAKGVQTLINAATEISKRNQINTNCALHFHIGNFEVSRALIVTLYKLSIQIQDALFKMFPVYKTDEVKYLGKQKNYCQKINSLFPIRNESFDKESYHNYINDNYLRIYRFLLETDHFPSKKFNRRNKKHPKTHKWDRHSRYYWLNFINLITSQRNTVEFRLHTPTLNPQKIVTWLFICNAIVKTAQFRQKDILTSETFSIDTVFDYYKDFYKTKSAETLSNYLKAYYNHRCFYFEDQFKKGDVKSIKEIEQDAAFSLDYSFIIDMFK